ncbi:NAD-binding protein [Streptomyces sp. SR27]|uniref:NAD-binding protein n=1 Tax=Streptomyces sp. SR27 TaxID=3076630 RepID=UPI00295B3371|nr:NAD-binding protein [Streptomyces sp. SR27]MDV9190934.1 NAD-binding protein [Streptomyces sp. SR27]
MSTDTTSARPGRRLLARVLGGGAAGPWAVEEYGLPFHRGLLTEAGIATVPVAVDGNGARTAEIPRHARAVLLTPAHQFPTGGPLHPERRAGVLEWARVSGGLVVEDDYDGEFRYDRRPVGAVQGLDPDRTVLLGSVSKSLSPALRIGWMCLPAGLVDRVVAAKGVREPHTSATEQLTLAGFLASVLALTYVTTLLTDADPVHAAYLTLLDLFSINDPALGAPVTHQVLQLLSGLVGLALLPLLVAGGLEALGTFRDASALRRPPRRLSGHVVLLGLGKVGTRVLARLRELDIPVVCVEEDPDARGIPLARSLHVPVVLGDVTEDGVLEAAKIDRAHALLALTSSDTTNLEAVLSARTAKADLRVALRLFDDDFATAVHRTLRTAYPDALTRSRSVSHLAAPAFAGAMMGRQILGAIPVERKVLLFAALLVAGHPQFEGRTVAEAFRPGGWRVLALDTAVPAARRPDLASARQDGDRPELLWELHPGYVLRPEDRVVIAATRRGLAELLARRPADRDARGA